MNGVELDHLIVAGPNLEEAVEYVEALLGVEATPGGSHPGIGTRNALVRLDPGAYIEIIGPDPAQPDPEVPRWFGIDTLEAPRLATWSARVEPAETDGETRRALERMAALARSGGVELGPISRGGRVRTDGVALRWRVTDPRADRYGGVFPFLMDWGESPHPSADLPPGVTLARLRGFHPRSKALRQSAASLSLPIDLVAGPEPRLEAELRTERRLVTLR